MNKRIVMTMRVFPSLLLILVASVFQTVAADTNNNAAPTTRASGFLEPADPECSGELDEQFLRTFKWHGRDYEVRFVKGPETELAWPQDLVLRYRLSGNAKWHVVSKITQVRSEKEVILSDARGREIDALVVSSPGCSASFISIVQICKDPPGLRLLLDSARDKGGFDYRYDTAGRLIGLKFHYWAWHVEPGDLQAHAYTAMNVGWIRAKGQFRKGPVFVDDVREEKATLMDILRHIVDVEETVVHEIPDIDSNTYTYIYRPVGLLWRKTPPELRSANKVRVVVKHCPEPDREPYIAEIGAVTETR